VPTDHRTVAAIPAALTKPILAKSEPTAVVPAPGLQKPQAVQGAESLFSEASSTGKPPSSPPSAVAAVSETRKQAPAQSRPSLQPDLRRTSPESPLGKESATKYQIIFSSLPTEEAARVERDRLATLSSKPHGDPSVLIEKVDLGEGQVAYRVLASEVPTRETADDFCASVNRSGGDCLVIERQAK
jgi:hypothetical protein